VDGVIEVERDARNLADTADAHWPARAPGLARDALACCSTFDRLTIEIRALMRFARLHTAVPAGDPRAGAGDHAAALACLREAVAIYDSIEGHQISGGLNDVLAREHAHASDVAILRAWAP
jgi:hypothetical protein